MLAYAANRPVAGKRQSSPNALLIVISIHVALLAVVMSAKMDLPQRIRDRPTIVDFFPRPMPPQPVKPPPAPPARHTARISDLRPNVSLPATSNATVDPGPTPTDVGPALGASTAIIPTLPKLTPTPIRHGALLLTPPSELKPPYPASKLLSEEEAVLRLRLTIDANGRVVAVDPVGTADRAFLEAARRHLMAHWRYQPATEDGRTVASSMVITLRFELDG
jgi:protein TonB